MMAASSACNRRCQKDLQFITGPEVESYFHYESSDYEDNAQSRLFVIYGYILPRSFAYNHGSFKVKITLPPEYPFKMPKLVFLTEIYHIRIPNCVGKLTPFCCDMCFHWTPKRTVAEMIERAVNIIDGTVDHIPEHGRNLEAVEHYERDSDEYWRTVMNSIEKNAYPRTNESVLSLKFTAKRVIRKQLGFDSRKINQLPLSKTLKEYLHLPFDKK